MWKEKLQDTAASHPWLEPHEAIKRKTQAPGMQLVDWYGFTVPKTKKEMFLKQSARREDLLVVGEVDNIHSFFSDYETEWRSNILFDDLDEALRYCEDVRSGFISDIQLHSSFIMYKEPGFKAMPGGGFAGLPSPRSKILPFESPKAIPHNRESRFGRTLKFLPTM